MAINLIKEAPSPNVTKNIPFAFDMPSGYLDYTCEVNNGIYIFDPHYQDDADVIQNAFDNAFDLYRDKMYPVDVTGFKNPEGRIGSERFCTMSSSLAMFFTRVIINSNMLDLYNGEEFVQVSKYFRAMKYQNGGEHFPHYDSNFVLDDTLITKMSLVCYGDDCETGEIAFVRSFRDDQNTQDWDRQATDDEIFLKVKPKAGRIVVFDHRVCHTVLPYTEDKQRRVLRGDLIFSPL